jgi:type VI secretion system secreted protein VgrG
MPKTAVMPLRDFELVLLSSDFEPSQVRINRLRLEERMSCLFSLELEVVALSAEVAIDALAGSHLTVAMTVGDETVRRVSGLVTRVEELPRAGQGEQRHQLYRLEVRPRAWLSTLVDTLDIYLDCTLPDILGRKLAAFGLGAGADHELKLTQAYPRREMTVQYQETDLAFLSRLTEHWGVFFYFEHGEAERLVFGDDAGAYRPIEGERAVHYSARGDERGVFEVRAERALVPAHYVCRDYNDQTPSLELMEEHHLAEGFGGGIIEYGADFRTPELGHYLARVRAEERLALRDVYSGGSDEPRFAPGHVFALEDHPRYSQPLVLVSVVHEASQSVAGWGEGSERAYVNRFTAIPSERTFRPPRVTKVPRIHGLVTGVVETHQGGMERHARIDDQGRYTVRFLFDTAAPGERKASCQVRMMQSLAGPGYGVHFPLKPGTEVAVAFVDGNPDRPLIVGAVPNPITPTPVNATISTKSRIQTRAGIVIEFDDADRG